jgi:hypothetical protein
MEISRCCPQGQHQSASRRYMDKLHIFWLSHLHQVVPDCDVYPPAIGWSIELILIGSVP